MRKIYFAVGIAGVMIAALLSLFGIAWGQTGSGENSGGDRLVNSETLGDSIREIYAPTGSDAAEAPSISFIDSPTATCYLPDITVDACFINWYYMYVDASPNYMIAMTATLNAYGPVVRYSGFFQTSMYAPFNMQDRGFKVPCGALGAGGNPKLGNAYGYTIRARASDGLKSANYGTVYCPAYIP